MAGSAELKRRGAVELRFAAGNPQNSQEGMEEVDESTYELATCFGGSSDGLWWLADEEGVVDVRESAPQAHHFNAKTSAQGGKVF